MIKWYPIIVFVVWIVPLINRFGEAIGWQNDVIDEIRGFMILIHGFLDSLAYCYTVPVLSLWKTSILAMFGAASQAAANQLDVGEDIVSPSITGLLETEVVNSSANRHSDASEGDYRTSFNVQQGPSASIPSSSSNNLGHNKY